MTAANLEDTKVTMFDWFKNRAQHRTKAQKLYGAVVTLARTPRFYSDFGVPDTPEGRFEMVALILFLAMERLKGVPEATGLVQSTIESFVTDMDDCMREMGVGDLVVPKKVKRAAAAFYERAGSYRDPIATNNEDALTEALRGHIWNGEGAEGAGARALSRLALQFNAALAAAPDSAIVDGSTLVGLANDSATTNGTTV